MSGDFPIVSDLRIFDIDRTSHSYQLGLAQAKIAELEAIVAALRAAPAQEPVDLTCDFAQSLPGGKLDDSTYEKIETALDKIEAPCKSADGKWLSLHERVAAIAAPPADAKAADLVKALEVAQKTLKRIGFVGRGSYGDGDREMNVINDALAAWKARDNE